MLLQITTTHRPARDLGYLVGKHPDRLQTFALSNGQAHVFFPEATDERTTLAMLMELDPVGLVRGRGNTLNQYVNDRPYVTSSYFSVALGSVLRDALKGRAPDRQELADTAIPLEAEIHEVSAPNEHAIREFFEPLGWEVDVEAYPLDAHFPDWGTARSFTVHLAGTARLADLVSHLYVLLPALDGNKHYFIDDAEVEKLLRHADDWLPEHPQRDRITRAYLERRRHLVTKAEAELANRVQPLDDPESLDELDEAEEQQVDKPLRLHEARLERVAEILKGAGATSVLDLGCGEGKLLRVLAETPQFQRIVGLDVVLERLKRATRRLRLDEGRHDGRVELLHGSLLYPDDRLRDFDAAALVEVIEHIELDRLTTVVEVLFGSTRPQTVVITTPNADYNVLFDGLPAGKFRHGDHRFEWSREEFARWSEGVCEAHGYSVRFEGIGPDDPAHGAPTQVAVFTRGEVQS